MWLEHWAVRGFHFFRLGSFWRCFFGEAAVNEENKLRDLTENNRDEAAFLPRRHLWWEGNMAVFWREGDVIEGCDIYPIMQRELRSSRALAGQTSSRLRAAGEETKEGKPLTLPIWKLIEWNKQLHFFQAVFQELKFQR